MSKKLTIYIFVFFIIAVTATNFAIGERIKFNELPAAVIDRLLGIIGLNHPKPSEPIQTYELLIKKSKTGVGKGVYQEGDIVAIKPIGHNWSTGELSNFWIVTMNLTPTQAEELVKPKERLADEKDEEGRPVMEMEARRKYYIDTNLLKSVEVGQIIDSEMVEER